MESLKSNRAEDCTWWDQWIQIVEVNLKVRCHGPMANSDAEDRTKNSSSAWIYSCSSNPLTCTSRYCAQAPFQSLNCASLQSQGQQYPLLDSMLWGQPRCVRRWICSRSNAIYIYSLLTHGPSCSCSRSTTQNVRRHATFRCRRVYSLLKTHVSLGETFRTYGSNLLMALTIWFL